jgi:hypothetical protein
MPKARKESLPKASKRDSFPTNEKINIPSYSNNQSWDGLLNAQGLPALPFAAIPPSVDINLVVALAQVMTMNALKALSQNQSISQNNPQSEKERKKEIMMTLQEKLRNRKSHPPLPVFKKKSNKKEKLAQKASPQSQSNMSNLELLALATTAHADGSSPETTTYSNQAGSEKSPGILTALQAGFPNIDWGKMDSIPSPSAEALQSILSNVSESS